MDGSQLLEAHLPLIGQIIGRVCRRSRLLGPDAEDFASSVKLALIENDYALLRNAAQRSSLPAYLTVVIQRMAFDDRSRTFGRWTPSAAAQRLGEAGILAETLLVRDRRTLDDALPFVRRVDPAMTREGLAALAAQFPEHHGRPRAVALADEAIDRVPSGDAADAAANAGELRTLANRTGQAMRDALAKLPLEDRMLLRFRFASSMTIADISRILRLPQRPLYRRLESLLARLRGVLAAAGVDGAAVSELIGSATAEMHFGLDDGKNGELLQSSKDERP